jgi:hypothetical protein
LKVSVWSATAWAGPVVGRPLAGLAVAGVTAALLPRKLAPVGVPAGESLKLALYGHLGAGRLLADAVTRAWWPLAVPTLASTRRGRWLLAAAYGQHLREWHQCRPPIDPLRWTALRALDDLCYGAGVWWGALQERTVAPLLPDLTDWPGRNGVGTEGGDGERETGPGTKAVAKPVGSTGSTTASGTDGHGTRTDGGGTAMHDSSTHTSSKPPDDSTGTHTHESETPMHHTSTHTSSKPPDHSTGDAASGGVALPEPSA